MSSRQEPNHEDDARSILMIVVVVVVLVVLVVVVEVELLVVVVASLRQKAVGGRGAVLRRPTSSHVGSVDFEDFHLEATRSDGERLHNNPFISMYLSLLLMYLLLLLYFLLMLLLNL